jgi:SAM-dependent methyltransferase
MTFSQEWDACYAGNTHLSVWPWSDLVSLVFRHCNRNPPEQRRVLELGCGAGANIPFLSHWSPAYFGIEGSAAIVKVLHDRFPALRNNIACADFTSTLVFEGLFDLIVDRASITHNNTASIAKVLEHVWHSLKPGGVFIGVDWFSTRHSDFQEGVREDDYTRNAFDAGQFAGVGRVHFSDEAHLRTLFSRFDMRLLEEKTIIRREPQDEHVFASWNIVARRPHA